jgi:MmyB-like transcription regulator ligand binding domain
LVTLTEVENDVDCLLNRENSVEVPVVGALARALRLDADATAYLFALGRPAPEVLQSPPAAAGGVSPDVQDLLDAWNSIPAFVHGRQLDVLSANGLARALTPVAEPGTNMLRSFFLDPEGPERYDDLGNVLATAVAYFRANVGSHLDAPGVRSLVAELSLESEEFSDMWARHDVQSALSGEDLYFHPAVVAMRLRYRTFPLGGADGQTLFVVSAAPGSRDAQALADLADVAAELETSIS